MTKITPPRRDGIIARNRLIKLIDQGKEKITWITGPAGSGKTTLAADYITTRRMPCLWYQMDMGDEDISNIFHYMALALKRVRPRLRSTLPSFNPEHRAGLEPFTRRFFEQLYSHLRWKTNPWPIVVLDDFHHLKAESVQKLLRIGLEVVPDNIRVLVLSREAPLGCYAGLRASGIMSVLDGADLRFSETEGRALLDLSSRRARLSEETIQFIQDCCQGWAAGLRLLSEIADDSSALKTMPPLSRELVFDYFLNELFKVLPDSDKLFLLKTAFLPFMTPGTAQALTNFSNSSTLLRKMTVQNFFITQHSGPVPTYRYHQLFREFLLDQASSTFSTECLSLIRRKAGEILIDAGHLEEAVEFYLGVGFWEQSTTILEHLAPSMLSQGRGEILEKWVSQVPDAVLDECPWLLYWKALAQLPRDLPAGRSSLKTALQGFEQKEDRQGMVLSHAEMILSFFLELGDFSRMEPHFLSLMHLCGQDFCFPGLDDEAKVATSMILGGTFCRPDHPRLPEWIDRSEDLLHAEVNIEQKITLGFYLHILNIYMGNLYGARRVYSKIQILSEHGAISDLGRLQWMVLDAVHNHLVVPNFTYCTEVIQKALDLAEQTNLRMYNVLLLQIMGYAMVNTGNVRDLETLIKRLNPMIPEAHAFDVSNQHCLLCCEKLCRGDGQGARTQAHLAFKAIPKPKTPFPTILGLIGLAEAAIEAGDWPEARSFLKKARRISTRIPDYQGDVLFLMPVAYAAFLRGKESVGLRVLKTALARARKGWWLNALFWRPRQLALLCAAAWNAGLEREYVAKLIHIHKLPRLAPAILPESEREGIEVITFGGLEVTRNGQQLCLSKGKEGKAMTLLKGLLVLGGQNIPSEALTDLLWPESEGDKAMQSLKFTLHTLRRILAFPDVVLVQNRTVSLNPLRCRLDVWQFEQAYHKLGDATLNIAPTEEQIKLCLRIVSLYKGDFLAPDPTGWISPVRARLKSRFRQVIDLLLQISKQTKNRELEWAAMALMDRFFSNEPLAGEQVR
ncbi:AAA family ATPase [Desulfonatronum thiosulfatophilum]|uniref:AAA family ATPase n=1 Tax=Desulfonatronum thiosulfatophilum TaxID=617002 RepID=UPI00137AE7FC|nr:AAA family ATPase [Desulfonatronum thiosulfatophilum]